VSRTDTDWVQTQLLKITNLHRLAEKIQLDGRVGADGILHAGDLFHQPKGELISRRVDIWLAKKLNESLFIWDTIPGNHDMKGHRLDSLETHPYGSLVAAGLINQVTWPNYVVRGSDPPVIVTGKEFVPEGPGPWLKFLADTRELYTIKNQVGENAKCVALTHGWWGPTETTNRGEPVTPHDAVKGIDAMVYGHPHTLDGITYVQDETSNIPIIGPGAFIRGTIAEHDVNRKPQIAVLVFKSNAPSQVMLVAVPHEPPEKVFNLEGRKRQQAAQDVQMQFIAECRQLETTALTIEALMASAAANGTSSRAINLAREFIVRAQAKESR
jgi:hypothetical protein